MIAEAREHVIQGIDDHFQLAVARAGLILREEDRSQWRHAWDFFAKVGGHFQSTKHEVSGHEGGPVMIDLAGAFGLDPCDLEDEDD